MVRHQPVVGVVSFVDARTATAGSEERDLFVRQRHNEMVRYLRECGFKVVDPEGDETCGCSGDAFGLKTAGGVDACLAELQRQQVDCLVIPCTSWAQPVRPLRLIRGLNKPVLLYAEEDDKWAGGVMMTALGASLWEVAPNSHALAHERVRGDLALVKDWVLGVSAFEYLRRSTLVLWGGTYCEGMAHLMDDVPALHSFLVGDIVSVDTSELIRRAESILQHAPSRTVSFVEWLLSHGTKITYDARMCTPDALHRQVALYLAARDFLREFPEPVAGASIRCQPELSTEFGCTACLIPSFLPFPEDNEGRHGFIPTVCEGDIKGLVTSVALSKITSVPPLFGDLKQVKKEYIILSNCGGASVYYAANSTDPGQALPHVRLEAQCQGASGAAVGYFGKEGPVTVARLQRVNGVYFMQLGHGRAMAVSKDMADQILWGQTWPHVCIDIGVAPGLFQNIAASNHYSAVPGDCTKSVEYFCREAGIRVLRIDSDDGAKAAMELIHEAALRKERR